MNWTIEGLGQDRRSKRWFALLTVGDAQVKVESEFPEEVVKVANEIERLRRTLEAK